MKKIKKIMMTLTMLAFMFGLASIGSVKVQAASPSIDKSVTYNFDTYNSLTPNWYYKVLR